MSDGLWFTKDVNGYRGWFRVEQNNGTLRTGATSIGFTVTIVNPGDTASTSPSVSESSTKPGLYYFDIPSSFFTTNGVGVYGVVVEVDINTAPRVTGTFGAMLRVNTKDLEDLVGADVSAIAEAVWEYVPSSVVPGSFGEFISELYESRALATGNTQSGTTSTSIKTDISQPDDYFDGYYIYVIDDTDPSSGIDVAIRKIDSYLNTDGEFIPVAALPFTPADGSRVIILGNHDERSGVV